MRKKASSSKGRVELTQKDWGTIMEDLFHQLSSSMVSLEGYTAILSNEYFAKLDQKGKHYVRRIRKNMKDMERVIRILRECVNKDGKM